MGNIGKNHPKIKNFGFFIVVFLLLMSLVANGVMGYNIISNQPRVGVVCGDKHINSINAIVKSNNVDINEVKKIYSDIKALDKQNIDPNCQAIVFIGSFISGSLNDSKEAYNNLISLGKKGLNPSLKIDFPMSYDSLKEKTEVNLDDKMKVER